MCFPSAGGVILRKMKQKEATMVARDMVYGRRCSTQERNSTDYLLCIT